MMNRLLTMDEASEYLGISKLTLYVTRAFHTTPGTLELQQLFGCRHGN